MKNVFFLIAFLFSVVCFAAPPPDMSSSFLTEDVGVIRSLGDIAVQTLEVQEVTYAYIGDCFYSKSGYINKLHGWEANKQNTNFGYPFGADF